MTAPSRAGPHHVAFAALGLDRAGAYFLPKPQYEMLKRVDVFGICTALDLLQEIAYRYSVACVRR